MPAGTDLNVTAGQAVYEPAATPSEVALRVVEPEESVETHEPPPSTTPVTIAATSIDPAGTGAVSSGVVMAGTTAVRVSVEAVGALVARAVVRLGGSFLTDAPLVLIAVAGFALTLFAGANFILVLLGAGIAYEIWRNARAWVGRAGSFTIGPLGIVVVAAGAIGLSLGTFWEMFEWFGKTFIDGAIYVGYRDTIGDIVWGGLGSLLAGILMPVLIAHPRRAPVATTAGGTPAAATDGPPARPVV